jgi:hypothetical protein
MPQCRKNKLVILYDSALISVVSNQWSTQDHKRPTVLPIKILLFSMAGLRAFLYSGNCRPDADQIKHCSKQKAKRFSKTLQHLLFLRR